MATPAEANFGASTTANQRAEEKDPATSTPLTPVDHSSTSSPLEEHEPRLIRQGDGAGSHEFLPLLSDDNAQNALELQALRQRVAHLEEELKSTKEVLVQEQETMGAARAQLNKQATELWMLQKERISKVDDEEYIEGKWHELDNKIKQWSIRHFGTLSTSRSKPQQPPSIVCRRLDWFDQFWDFDCARHMIVRAIVWEYISMRIFDEWAAVYSGQYQGSFQMLKRALNPECGTNVKERDYHIWRSMTNVLLASKLDESLRGEVNRVMNAPWVNGLLACSASSKQNVEADLRDLMTQAIELDLELKQQRAHYFVKQGCRSRQVEEQDLFDWDNMDSIEGLGPEHTAHAGVVLVMRPILFKRGTAGGEHYDKLRTISKAKVICDDHWHRLIQEEEEENKKRQGDAKKLRKKNNFL